MSFGIAYGCVLIISFLVGLLVKKQFIKIYFFISNFFIALPTLFFYIPSNIYWDSIRFENLLNIMRQYNASGIFQGLKWGLNYSVYASQPLDVYYIWFFSLFKSNHFFFYSTIVFFLTFMSLLILQSLKNKGTTKNAAVITQLVVLMIFNIVFEIAGIRNFLAFMSFAAVSYIEINTKSRKNKIICWIIYLLAYFFHPSVLIFIIFRIIILFKKKVLNYLVEVISLTYTLFLSIIISIIASIPFFNNISSRIEIYLYGQSGYSTHAGINEIIFTSIILIYLIFELFVVYKLKLKKLFNQSYLTLYNMSLLFTVGSFLNTQIYLRSIMLLLFMSIPIKINLFSSFITNDHISSSADSISLIFYKMATIGTSVILFMYWYYVYYSTAFVF